MAAPAAVATFATVGFVPAPSSMPLVTRAAAASSNATSRSAAPAGTVALRTKYLVMSLGGSTLTSGGRRPHARSLTTVESSRKVASPLVGAPGMIAEHGAPSSGTRRGDRSA
jgi:hypothetical protein